MEPAGIIRRVRRAARLTQRELAARSGIDQATIARIERGLITPRVDTFVSLLEAAGYELEAIHRPVPDVDIAGLREAMAMSDLDRERYFIESNRNMQAMFEEARRS
jgi:transcriptional regulator with XRE-family HTH domain